MFNCLCGISDSIYSALHDDVTKWKPLPRYWPFVRGIHRSPMNSPHKCQWRGALKFSLVSASIKCLRKGGHFVYGDDELIVSISVYFYLFTWFIFQVNSSKGPWLIMQAGRIAESILILCHFVFSNLLISYATGVMIISVVLHELMTSSSGNIFRVTGHLCGEFTRHRSISCTKARDAELWCFLWSEPE